MNKYHAQRVELDGYTFDSRAEARRYWTLKQLQAAGEIHLLTVHPRYSLHVDGHEIGHYVGDFYYDSSAGPVLEDVKSRPTRTPLYRWKKKHMLAEYGLEIREVE